LEREVKGLNGLKSGINRNLVTMYPPKFDLPKGIEYADAVDFFTGKFAL
jgi:hypothetical protein